MSLREHMKAAFYEELTDIEKTALVREGLTAWSRLAGAGTEAATAGERVFGAANKGGFFNTLKHHYGVGAKAADDAAKAAGEEAGGISRAWSGLKEVHKQTPITGMAATAAAPVAAGGVMFGGDKYYNR